MLSKRIDLYLMIKFCFDHEFLPQILWTKAPAYHHAMLGSTNAIPIIPSRGIPNHKVS